MLARPEDPHPRRFALLRRLRRAFVTASRIAGFHRGVFPKQATYAARSATVSLKQLGAMIHQDAVSARSTTRDPALSPVRAGWFAFPLAPALRSTNSAAVNRIRLCFVRRFPRYYARGCPAARAPRAAKRRPRREERDAVAPFHSMTSSARTSSVFGTFKPSALAVFMLITSSHFTGCCTGRSAGLSPRRMRST